MRHYIVCKSLMEMTSRRALLLAPPISEKKDTEFVISNGNTTSQDKNSDIDKVDLANGHLTNLDDVIGQPPSVEVPEHILEGRFMLRSNPAVAASPPLDRKEDTKDDKDDEDEDLTHLSQDSTTDCYDVSTTEFGDFTQLTDLSMLTNSDVSDNEELTRLLYNMYNIIHISTYRDGKDIYPHYIIIYTHAVLSRGSGGVYWDRGAEW